MLFSILEHFAILAKFLVGQGKHLSIILCNDFSPDACNSQQEIYNLVLLFDFFFVWGFVIDTVNAKLGLSFYLKMKRKKSLFIMNKEK